MSPQEAGKQKFEKLKKQAVLVLTTAFRAPLMLMMGCTVLDKKSMSSDNIMHDHGDKKIVHVALKNEEYHPNKHGKIKVHFKEGDVLFESGGKKAVHRHPKNGEQLPTSNGIEFKWE